jgi:predicted PurR-regulated permease PerM
MPLGGEITLWTLLLYLAVQQLEGNVISPAIMRRTVHLPPAVTLFSVVAFGVLFGPLGVLLAAPLSVTVAVFVGWMDERRRAGMPAA